MTTEEKIEEKSKYTRKIQSPIYEPRDNNFKVSDLYDTTKRDSLIYEINQEKDLPDDLKHFLISSAERHVVFDFSKIADYYAKLPLKFKPLFENSALVIIDYNKAILNGFVDYEKTIQEGISEYLESIPEEKLQNNKDELNNKRTSKEKIGIQDNLMEW